MGDTEQVTSKSARRRGDLAVAVLAIALFLVGGRVNEWSVAREIQEQNETTRVAACRTRNTGREHDRRDTMLIVEGFYEYAARVDDAEAVEYVDREVRPRLSGPTDTDRDCDGDGRLTRSDYDDVWPDGLPITLP
jgi:hypothetical protein